MQGHLLYFKNENGEWVALPVAVIDVYDSYVAYCDANAITPLSKEAYYKALSDVDTKLTNISNVLGNLEDISALQNVIESLNDGLLPTTMGGTGKSLADEKALIAYLRTGLTNNAMGAPLALASEVEELADEVNEAITHYEDKLDASEISAGEDAPTDSTPGTYYFQYTE